jgi:Radical SAM superfamily/4Fe-4S single cluster domain
MNAPARRPLCVAPSTALLIDPDKSVRPCCRYFPPMGKHLAGSVGIGRIDAETTVAAVRESAAWRDVADQLADQQMPEGCRDCLTQERETGLAGSREYDDEDWQKGITFLEINTSNICTLQCRHCDGYFSHRWARVQGMPTHKADSALLLDSLRGVDLSHLKRVAFKGGEPLINPDLVAVLRHLDSIGRLEHVTVRITTNGTVAPEEPLALLRKARGCEIGISVDGFGDVQTYIRHGASSVDKIARFVEVYASIPRVRFGVIVSVMAYNVFSLPAIAAWWRALAGYRLGNKWIQRWRRWRGRAEFRPISFLHFVTSPQHLSMSSLQDATRAQLIARFQALDPILYEQVIRRLQAPFAGNQVHDQLVIETLRNDRLLGRTCGDAIPELGPELELLDADAAFADLERKRQRGAMSQPEFEQEFALLSALPRRRPGQGAVR